MRLVILFIVSLGCGVPPGVAWAQPKAGDLILAFEPAQTGRTGWLGYMDPAKPSVVSTITVATATFSPTFVRMADDNTTLIVSESRWWTMQTSQAANLVQVSPAGARITLAWPGGGLLPGRPSAFELDHDGRWIVAANANFMALNYQTLFALTTPFQSTILAHFRPATDEYLGGLVIDRDPGAPTYCAAQSFLTKTGPRYALASLLGFDRNGIVTTVLGSFRQFQSLQLHPRSGDYIVAHNVGPGAPTIARITKSGAATPVATLTSGLWWGPLRITQDDHLWTRDGWGRLYKIHIPTGNTIQTIPTQFLGAGLVRPEVYGCRGVVCYQAPSSPTSVMIRVQSRHPLARGASYLLAASPARRPGVQMANGEWLDLDVTHPLFRVTVHNVLPSVFVNFQGALDQSGNNAKPIRVNIPTGLPAFGGVAIFVAGVVHKNGQVVEVTNSHWFVLK